MTIPQLPPGFLGRHPTLDDLPAMVQLRNIYQAALRSPSPVRTLDAVRAYWSTPGKDLAHDVHLVFYSTGLLVGAAITEHLQPARIFTEGLVHPDYQRRGIGSYLLAQSEDHARAYIPRVSPELQVSLHAGAEQQNTASQKLLTRQGFQPVRSFYQMAITLRTAPATPRWPDGIFVCELVPGMECEVFEAKEEFFRDHWGYVPDTYESWVQRTLERSDFDRTLCFLAMADDEIAGLALCSSKNIGDGWIHTLGVRRPWRHLGLGLALLLHSFSTFHQRGISRVFLRVDSQNVTGATRLYERAGMRVVQQQNYYAKELRPGVIPTHLPGVAR